MMDAHRYRRKAMDVMDHGSAAELERILYIKEMQIASLELEVHAYRHKLLSIGLRGISDWKEESPAKIFQAMSLAPSEIFDHLSTCTINGSLENYDGTDSFGSSEMDANQRKDLWLLGRELETDEWPKDLNEYNAILDRIGSDFEPMRNVDISSCSKDKDTDSCFEIDPDDHCKNGFMKRKESDGDRDDKEILVSEEVPITNQSTGYHEKTEELKLDFPLVQPEVQQLQIRLQHLEDDIQSIKQTVVGRVNEELGLIRQISEKLSTQQELKKIQELVEMDASVLECESKPGLAQILQPQELKSFFLCRATKVILESLHAKAHREDQCRDCSKCT
ncbi:uncharacterized protein LOC110007948 isoform X2 [Amborella trichopoda]|nr:uncharacterized protein LOC110007948 isoform X2 [Amborella trichopoda]XP_020528067.1 uncharacterized protein LOC110007948 isoform X2 [Amborella trichopoda]XP_020528068.1 uncharacterized protein LOC110007948 isoform X2 [Amborella trichopoda]|eukprot:XP_020528066.1 uncharacterized protein LOC110007948 isoform X2 [Amborella trichopoda]